MPKTLPFPERLCPNQQETTSVTTRDRRSGDEALGRKPFIAQLWKSKPMKRIPFLRGPITHKFKRPHSKAEEPDCLFRRYPPSIMITTQSPRGRDDCWGLHLLVPIFLASSKNCAIPLSVRGCFTICSIMAGGIVTISAPISPASITWMGFRILATMIRVSISS